MGKPEDATLHRSVRYIRLMMFGYPRETWEILKIAFEEWGKRLDSVIETRGPHEKPERLFSREIKQELYDQNSTCVFLRSADQTYK